MKKPSGSHIRLQSRARKLVDNDAKLMSELLSMRRTKDIADDTVARRMGVTVEQLIAIDSGTLDPTLGQVRRYAHAIGALVEHSVMDGLMPSVRIRLL